MSYCCEIFKNTYFEEHLYTAASELTLESDIRNFVSGKSLSKPSWLGNITKIPVAFKPELLNTIRRICCLYIQRLHFLLNLVSVCLSLTVTTQKPNAYSPWTPCSKFMCKRHANIKHQVYFRLSKEHSIMYCLSIHVNFIGLWWGH